MADQVQQFACTIPPNTPISAPVTFPLNVGVFVVDEIDVKVPAGCNGFVGFRIGSAGTQLIPFTPGSWAVFNDDLLQFPLTNQHDSGAWQLIGYNTGNFQHTLQVVFHLVNTPDQSGQVPDPIAAAALE